MKTQYETVFTAHVTARVQKAVALGLMASWSTANHLDALAEACSKAAGSVAPDLDAKQAAIRECLGECYNVSAFQQTLAKKFEKTGHFQRQAVKGTAERLDDTLALLAASLPKV